MPRGRSDRITRHFGEVIQSLRWGRGWTLKDFGKATGMNPDYLGLLERGRNVPSLHSLLAIADAFDMSVGQLLAPIDEERKPLRASKKAAREQLK